MNQLKFLIPTHFMFISGSLMLCMLNANAHAQSGVAISNIVTQSILVQSAPSEKQVELAKRKLDTLKADANANYLANPNVITQFGFQSVWQTTIPHRGVALFAGMSLDGNEIFAWDKLGVVTRLKPSTGTVLWQGSTQSKLDKIYSVTVLPAVTTPAAIALTDAATVAFEDESGALLAQESLRRVPATAGVKAGECVVFGDGEGRVIWLKLAESNIAKVATHRDAPGEFSSSKDLGQRRTLLCREVFAAMSLGKVVTAPVVAPGYGVLTVSSGGEVSLFNATNSKPIWRYKSNAPFVSKPNFLDGVVYVAGKDQYLHALDIKTGKSKWDWFNQSPLVNSPFATAEMVVLQVPDEGLVAFSTSPGDKVSGIILWKSKATGNVITRTKDGLITWDDASRTMTLVETKAGGITASANLPNARWVSSTSSVDGTILLLCDDGRMQQLRPIELMKSTSAVTPTETKTSVNQDAEVVEPATEPAKEPANEPATEPVTEPAKEPEMVFSAARNSFM